MIQQFWQGLAADCCWLRSAAPPPHTHTWMGPGERKQSWMAHTARMLTKLCMGGASRLTSALRITGLSLWRGVCVCGGGQFT